MARMGRPKSENPKSTQLSVRLDQGTLEKLDRCAEHYKETRVQILRRGIEKVFSEIEE